MARTNQTERTYSKRAQDLLRRFEQSCGCAWPESPEALKVWLEDVRDTLRPSSWRQYRAALAFFIEQDARAPEGLADAIRAIPPGDPVIKRSLRPRTSSRKARRIPESSIARLTEYLQDAHGQLDGIILQWLIAGRVTGLRPVEWHGATLLADEEDTMILRCTNAKATNGRSFGSHRTLIIRDVLPAERQAIRTMVALGAREDFEAVLARASRRLTAINAMLFGPLRARKTPGKDREHGMGVTLYSARHQFVADAKSAGLSKEEIAALMGHGSIETAGRHYGRRIHGNAHRFRVTPSYEDVSRVRQKNAPMDAVHSDVHDAAS